MQFYPYGHPLNPKIEKSRGSQVARGTWPRRRYCSWTEPGELPGEGASRLWSVDTQVLPGRRHTKVPEQSGTLSYEGRNGADGTSENKVAGRRSVEPAETVACSLDRC